MTIDRISASAVIPTPAERVYTVVADYHNGHPTFCPALFYVYPSGRGRQRRGYSCRRFYAADGASAEFSGNCFRARPGAGGGKRQLRCDDIHRRSPAGSFPGFSPRWWLSPAIWSQPSGTRRRFCRITCRFSSQSDSKLEE